MVGRPGNLQRYRFVSDRRHEGLLEEDHVAPRTLIRANKPVYNTSVGRVQDDEREIGSGLALQVGFGVWRTWWDD